MKDLKGIIFGALISINSFCGLSQQIYFNNIYNLCGIYDPEASSTGITNIETDDGYVIAGVAVDTVDFWMLRITFLKIDTSGDPVCKKDYGDNADDYYIGGPGALLGCNLGNFYLVGSINRYQPTNYDVGLLLKLDPQFDTIWTKIYDLNHDEQKDSSVIFCQLDICSNTDLIFGGSMNGSHLLLWRTDSSGNTKWYKTFHYGTNTLCTGYSVIQTTDNGFALGGFIYTIGQPETGNAVIVKTDSSGNQEWVKFLGGPYLDNTAMLSRSPDGNIIMGTAYGESMIGDNPVSRIYIAKLDNGGNIIWENKYADSQLYNYLINVRALDDGSIIVSGSSSDPLTFYGWILKVNLEGDSVWYRKERYFAGENSLHYLYDIIPTSDNGFLTCGDAIPISPDTGIRSAWVIKLDSIGCDSAGCDTTVGIKEDDKTVGLYDGKRCGLEVWPNPCREVLSVKVLGLSEGKDYKLVVYDIFGRSVFSFPPFGGRAGDGGRGREGRWTLDVSALPPGVYIAIVKNGVELVESRKFVVAR
jgi:hypothetical protein